MNDTIRALADAYHFAAVRHAPQRRKGAAAEPYVNHLTEVAQILADAGCDDPEIIIAGVLHDTIEDAGVTVEELKGRFGSRVASLVAEVTDDKALPSAERKRLQIEHAAAASPGAQLIKMADKIANLRSLQTSPPIEWDSLRKREYVKWATSVVDGCRLQSDMLADHFDQAAASLLSGEL